jgi:polynucleotide 5'-kinase involved in rRNA processing
MVVGTQKLVSKAFDLNADIVVVNTTGLVYGGPAIALKRFKVEAIEPNLIIFLERNGELRQLRQLFSKRYELYNAEVPTTIKSKSREERISFRNISLARYFKKPVRLEVEMNKVRVVNLIITRIPNEDEYINMIKALEGPKPLYIVGNHHTAVAVYEKSIPRDYLFKVRRLLSRYFSDVRITTIQRYKGLISAIFGTKGFLGLARVEELDLYSNKIILSTDIRDKSLVKEVHLGYIVLDENYNEKSTLKPGHGLL